LPSEQREFWKAITTQYYLPRDESKAYLGTVFHRKNAVDGTFERVEQLRFVPNTGYAFPVLADSWHSVEPNPPLECALKSAFMQRLVCFVEILRPFVQRPVISDPSAAT